MNKGYFLSIEGVDGAGKTTAIPYIKSLFESRGRTVVVTREPGGSPLAEQIRSLVLNNQTSTKTALLLMYAARRDHLENTIGPALEKDYVVITDRFYDTSEAYQGRVGGELTLNSLLKRTVVNHDPDQTLFFNAKYETCLSRLNQSGKVLDVMDLKNTEFKQGIHKAFNEMAHTYIRRMYEIDCDGDIESVNQQIKVWFDKQFPLP